MGRSRKASSEPKHQKKVLHHSLRQLKKGLGVVLLLPGTQVLFPFLYRPFSSSFFRCRYFYFRDATTSISLAQLRPRSKGANVNMVVRANQKYTLAPYRVERKLYSRRAGLFCQNPRT